MLAYFYPRSPCGERRKNWKMGNLTLQISIHALLAESDLPCLSSWDRLTNFYPRSPCGERRAVLGAKRRPCMDFYPRSPCGERRFFAANAERIAIISIHALLAESDNLKIHRAALVIIFLSTLSLRRATENGAVKCAPFSYFYPRSPCGERLTACRATEGDKHISIHALLAESDCVSLLMLWKPL